MSIELEKGLVDLIDGVANVYPRLPQRPTFPVIRYQRITTTRQHSVDGANVGVTEATLQVDILSDGYQEAKEKADAVRTILHGYSGAWGTLTARFCTLQTENDFYEQDGDRVTHWVSQRYRVWTNME